MKNSASWLMKLLMIGVMLLALAGTALAQGDSGPRGGGDFRRSDTSRLQDEHDRTERELGQIVVTPAAGGFDLRIDKKPMNPFTARVYLDGKKVEDQCRGECSGVLKVTVSRAVHGQRFLSECHAPVGAFPLTASIFIPQAGGIHCGFSQGASAMVKAGEVTPLAAWELALSPQDFAKVGACHNEHEPDTSGFKACLAGAGIQPDSHDQVARASSPAAN